ncbi:integrase family protein [Desulfofarcimen acetoxidans DSM 771]|uniref:Integrase family protein n=1 Tax=Desulfofarcimen acetoxidans (strain ATCC 49208 / DSM 771 / KCTC 5769 / VKM B-1644 / 5575) TaxID=485916 RepID=C8VZS9_DESAS|nr:tyrosine-type recombinase/integrase [Desulfofarcimen acetoxidans]ACV63057.1 integrase family protein [Desulfofarcimen acetoxidans DSM 771]
MYQDYNNAVGKVNKYLIENHFSMSVIYGHLHCYRSFKQYLEEKQISYSPEEALKWLNNNKPGWKRSKFKMSRLSLFRLNDVMRNGCISTDSYVYENSCNYDRLPLWCRLLLDGYLNNISHSFSEGYVAEHRVACSKFLIYISIIGGKNIEDINHKNVIGYYYQSEHSTVQAKNLYNRNIRHFLQYLAGKDLIPASLTYSLDRFIVPRIIIIDELPDVKKRSYIYSLDQTSGKIPATEYYSIAKKLGDTNLDRHNYSKTMRKVFRKAWRELYIFLEANGLGYSYKTAEYWCICLKNYTVQWKSYRRAMKLFEQYRVYGDIKPNIVYSYKEDSINTLPEWSRSLVLDFLSKKKKEGNSVSTVSMYRSSCLRFLKFLDKKNITCCAMINPEIIKEFHISDPHSTAEAKNAYSVRIRRFLDYLADMGYLPVTLQLALTTECAQKTEIVEILTEEEVASVYSFRSNAEKPMELRSTAIVLIGLRMGLRASDITGMKLSDISWKERTISVQQQKTDRFLKLPMSVDVGNSLYRYIMNGRPRVTSDYVFITHRVPYGKLNTSCCRRALNKALNKRKHGFHIIRKTFASRMLKSKTNVDTIANSLGHSDTSTVLKYLATDGDTMRQCALSLKGIEVKGGMLS